MTVAAAKTTNCEARLEASAVTRLSHETPVDAVRTSGHVGGESRRPVPYPDRTLFSRTDNPSRQKLWCRHAFRTVSRYAGPSDSLICGLAPRRTSPQGSRQDIQ